jgi:hypothetical protein
MHSVPNNFIIVFSLYFPGTHPMVTAMNSLYLIMHVLNSCAHCLSWSSHWSFPLHVYFHFLSKNKSSSRVHIITGDKLWFDFIIVDTQFEIGKKGIKIGEGSLILDWWSCVSSDEQTPTHTHSHSHTHTHTYLFSVISSFTTRCF